MGVAWVGSQWLMSMFANQELVELFESVHESVSGEGLGRMLASAAHAAALLARLSINAMPGVLASVLATDVSYVFSITFGVCQIWRKCIIKQKEILCARSF